MPHHPPLKTLILNNCESEISALRSFTRIFPSLFDIRQITGDLRDSRHILSAESFDVSFVNEDFFPVELIGKLGEQRFGNIIVFNEKETLLCPEFSSSSEAKYFFFKPPYDQKPTKLIQTVRAVAAQKARLKFAEPLKSFFTVKNRNHYIDIAYDNLIAVYCEGNLSTIFYEESGVIKYIPSGKQITEIEAKLNDSRFFQSDRNYLINQTFIKIIDSKERTLTLSNEKQTWDKPVTISVRKLRELLKLRKKL